MNEKLYVAKHDISARKALVDKAVMAGFGQAVVPALLDFLIDELAETPEVIQARVLINGPLSLDLDMRQARFGGDPIYLTPIEFRLTEYFTRKIGVVIPNKQILRDVWGKNAEERTQYLRVYVGQIRQKLGTDIIGTKAGVGYYMSPL